MGLHKGGIPDLGADLCLDLGRERRIEVLRRRSNVREQGLRASEQPRGILVVPCARLDRGQPLERLTNVRPETDLTERPAGFVGVLAGGVMLAQPVCSLAKVEEREADSLGNAFAPVVGEHVLEHRRGGGEVARVQCDDPEVQLGSYQVDFVSMCLRERGALLEMILGGSKILSLSAIMPSNLCAESSSNTAPSACAVVNMSVARTRARS